MRCPSETLWPLLLILLAACNLGSPVTIPTPITTFAAADAPPTPVQSTPDSRIEAFQEPVDQSTIYATHTPFPTLTATPPATPTPEPVRFAFPPAYESQARTAVEALGDDSARWRLLPVDDPAGSLDRGEAHIAWFPMQNFEGASGPWQAGSEPLALLVPFTDPLRGTTWAEARAADYPDCDSAGTFPCWQPWRWVEPRYRAVRLDGLWPDDPAYPARRDWELLTSLSGPLGVSLAEPLALALADDPLIEIAAVGDVMLDRSLNWYNLGVGELERPFAGVAEALRAPDLTIGNLESALGDVGEPAPKRYTFLAPPAAAPALAMAGFDVVSLANNHGMDYGEEALLQGIGLLHEAGVVPVGAGTNAAKAYGPDVVEVGGFRVAVLGRVNVPVEFSGFDTASWTAGADSPGLAWAEPEQLATDIAAARELADFVVLVLHSGHEYVEQPSPPQEALVTAALEAGAELVLGHHAHILQGIRFGEYGVTAYGLGNFAFDIEGPPASMIFHAWLGRDGVRQVDFTPTIVQFGGYPRLATPEEAAVIRRQVYGLVVE